MALSLQKAWVRASICCQLTLAVAAQPVSADLSTLAERSQFRQTGRYAEVEQLCRRLAAKFPQAVRVERFGQTSEGRPLLALVVESQPVRPKRPVVMIQAGIHAGEIDGKEAGFQVVRHLLQSRSPVLDRIRLVLIPVLNVDGHERFGRWNRPNQNGPEAMGWRVTAQNLNLNRDYAKAEAPEMQALLQLLNRYDPILYIDLHTTDGAQFQPDVAVLVEPQTVGSPLLQPWATSLQQATLADLRSRGHLPLDFYPSLRDPNDPASGFENGAYLPRFSTGYWALRNRLSVLVEAHSWKTFAQRVEVTRHCLEALLQQASLHGQAWQSCAQQADRESLAGSTQVVKSRCDQDFRWLDFPGYAYRREPSPLSGKIRLSYDPSTPQSWKVPYYYHLVPEVQVQAPRGGYLVPAAQAAWLEPKLRWHGLVYQKLTSAWGSAKVAAFRCHSVNFASRPYEGRMPVKALGKWSEEARDFEAGSLFVPIQQPKARLLLALFEPLAPDSWLSWGYFNAHLEQKEYMEDYLAEQVGQEFLARPEVADDFKAKLEQDPEFARDSEARLNYFYRLHPSWDREYLVYPVFRLEKAPIERLGRT